MCGVRLCYTLNDGGSKRGEVRVIRGVEALLFDELPQPLNEVKIRGIGREETQLNLSAGGERHDLGTALVAGVIQDYGHRNAEVECSQLPQEGANFGRGHIRVVGDRHEFMSDRVECPQDIEALPPCRCPQKNPRHRPQEPKEGS